MWTIAKIRQLHNAGKIRGYVVGKGNVKKQPGTVGNNMKSEAKTKMGWNLKHWCAEKKLPLVTEHFFSDKRKFRFDWAIPSIMVAIEFEGGIFQQNTSHNSARTYTKDTEKYNLAQSLGWTVIRFTAINYQNLITQLEDVYRSLDR